MNRVVTAIEIENCHRVIARRKREILIHVRPGIPAKLDAIVPDLHLIDRHRFICVGDNMNR